jgi:cobyrinic acid a,c-diamide synthase
MGLCFLSNKSNQVKTVTGQPSTPQQFYQIYIVHDQVFNFLYSSLSRAMKARRKLRDFSPVSQVRSCRSQSLLADIHFIRQDIKYRFTV